MEKTAEQETAKTFQRTRMVVMAAAFAALACVATMVVKVPSPTGGYMNLGDTVVLLGGYLLGPAWGALAGSIGPALADVLLGSPIYAPATLVIKAGMAALAAACHQAFGKGRGPLALRPAALWESCPWWWATGCTTPCCWERGWCRGGYPQQSGAGCLRHRRLHAAGGGSGPQRLRPAGVPPAVIPATWKKAPRRAFGPPGSFASAGESERCLWRGPWRGGGPRKEAGWRRAPGPARRRGLLKRAPAGSKTRRGL
ncbi:MAG: ECF transporter S component [Dysosmobacter welbionis]